MKRQEDVNAGQNEAEAEVRPPAPAVVGQLRDDGNTAAAKAAAYKVVVAELEASEPEFKTLAARIEGVLRDKTPQEKQRILDELRRQDEQVKKWDAVVIKKVDEKVIADEALREEAALARFQHQKPSEEEVAKRMTAREEARLQRDLKMAMEMSMADTPSAPEVALEQKPATAGTPVKEDKMTSEEERNAQQAAIFAQYELPEEERARREAARLERLAAAKKADETIAKLLKETAPEAQRQTPATPETAVDETKVSEEERRAQEELLARFKGPSEEEVATRMAAREEARLQQDLERAIAASVEEAKKVQTPVQEAETPVRVVFSHSASALEVKPQSPVNAVEKTPAVEQKTDVAVVPAKAESQVDEPAQRRVKSGETERERARREATEKRLADAKAGNKDNKKPGLGGKQ